MIMILVVYLSFLSFFNCYARFFLLNLLLLLLFVFLFLSALNRVLELKRGTALSLESPVAAVAWN